MQVNKLQFLISFLLFSSFALTANSKDGYSIKVHFTDVKNETKVYLGHYHGKGGSIYKVDSAILKKGKALLKSKRKINGGIYVLMFPDKVSMELILLNGNDFSFKTEKNDLSGKALFKGLSENELFYSYQKFLEEYGKGYNLLKEKYTNASSKKDSIAIRKQLQKKSRELLDYRTNFIERRPSTFLASLFKGLAEPKVPEYNDWPLTKEGVKDSLYPSLYYMQHYWDGYDFQDDRLIYSPLYQPKLKNYMDKWVVPIPDSVIKVCDRLLKNSEGTTETAKFTLWYLTYWSETSKIMGMEEVYVYLIENYYKIGKAPWASPEQIKLHVDKVNKIAPSICGQTAPDLNVRTMDNKFTPLSKVDAKYTLLVFYEADCGHCKKELPKLNKLYQEELHKYGVKIFAVETTNLIENWKKIITEKKLIDGWVHTYDPERITNFRLKYNVETVPAIFLLDKAKTIIGRRINHTNVLDLIKFTEKDPKRPE